MPAPSWHETDDFWLTTQSFMFPERRWDAAAGEMDLVQALLDLAPPATVLDLCCGPGRHALTLAERGFAVTGVDRTERFLAGAKERAAGVEFVLADMREFERAEAFDAAINMFTAFGYFEDPTDDRRVVENVFRSLRPGGRFLLDLVGKEVLARIFVERGWHEEADGTLVLEERKVDSGWSWIDNRWIVIRGQERREHRVGHRIYSAAELTGLLLACGFVEATAYGDLAGAPYDTTAKRLIVVARKAR